MKRLLVLLCLLFLSRETSAQPGGINVNDKVLSGTVCPPVNQPGGGNGTIYTCTGTGAVYTWTGSSWVAVGGGGGAPSDATYITQTPNGSLSAEQALSALSTGMARVTTTTGVVTSVTDAQSYYNVLLNGVVAGDVDTAGANSTAMLALLATVNTAGGGTIYFPPGTYRFDSQLLLPNNGASPSPDQSNIRLTGAGGGGSWYNTNASILDLRYTAVDGNAKIETRGRGTLVIDHLEIKDGGASNTTPLIHSTNTTMLIEANTFYGSGNVAQDAIVLGGTDTALGNGVNAPFQGYNTRILGNQFRNLNRGLYGLNYVNAVVFAHNSFLENVGTVAVELDGTNGGGQYDHGNSFLDNTFEMDVYQNAFKMTWASNNNFSGNAMFDGDASVTGFYNMSTNGYRNFILCGNPDSLVLPFLTGDATAVATTGVLCPNQQNDPIGNRGQVSSSLPYGLAVTGTYTSTDAYPGQLVVAEQFDPAERVSIGMDGSAHEAVIDSRKVGVALRPINLVSLSLKAPTTIVTESVGASALTLTGATQTSSFPVLSATQTWNNAGTTFTGMKFAATVTAAAAGSKLFELFGGAAGTTSKLYVQANGLINFNFGTTSANDAWGVDTNGIMFAQTNAVGRRWAVAITSGTYEVGMNLASDGAVTWANGTNITSPTRDIGLYRDGVGALGQRLTTTAQIYNLYNTWTSATNNEFFNSLWSSNVLHLGTNKGSGGGTARVMQLDYGGTTTAAISVPITSGQVTFGGGFVAGGLMTSSGSGMAVANVGANSCGTTAATIAGNSNSFEVTVGATSGTVCRVAFPTAAPNRWNCSPNNETTGNLVRSTVVDTTHVDFTGTFVAGDVVSSVCFPR